MTVTTKFEIGGEVWFTDKTGVRNLTIKDIHIHVSVRKSYVIKYEMVENTSPRKLFREEEIKFYQTSLFP